MERFPDLLWAWVRARPQAIAAEEIDGRRLSWRALGQRVADLAGRLRELGVSEERPVAVGMERSLDLVVALLAVQEAGGALLPLDPALPEARLRWLAEDAGATLGLVDAATLARLPLPTLLCVDRLAPAGPTAPLPLPPPRPPASSAAYILHTSGSTGQPKGVVVEHHSLLALARALPARFRADTRSRVLQFNGLAFDVAFFDLALWLGGGGRLVLAPQERLQPGPALARTLREGRISHLTCTPTVLAALPAEDLPALRHLMIGGEPLPPDLVARFGPRRRLHNVYGPTEATVACCAWQTRPGEGWPPIGHPIGEARLRVVDPEGRDCAPNQSGELWIGGPGLARGYLGRPELTARAFVQDPARGERWYRSGDRVRRREDGALVFEGRLDEQVKIRGVRVEPGEVELCLRQHPGIREAVVLPRAEEGATQLIAWVLPRDAGRVDPAALRAWLATRLPAAMVPRAFVPLDRLPTLPTGKLDRAALPSPSRARPELPEPYEAPAPGLEEALAARVARQLRVDPVGAQDDYYGLGGDSLAALGLLAELEQEYGRAPSLGTLAREPTVRGLARWLQAHSPGASAPVAPAPPVPPPGAPRLNPGQEGLWLEQRLRPRSTAEHLPALLRVQGPLDPERLRVAFGRLIARHESLRLRVREVDGRPEADLFPLDHPGLRAPRVEPPPTHDPAAADLEEAVLRQLDALRMAPFDLDRAPPWRARLLQVGPEDLRLLLAFHHLAVDAASLRILQEELAALLDEEPLPPPSSPFPSASAQREALQRGEHAAALAAAHEALGSLPPFVGLPPDRPIPEGALAPRLPARHPVRIEAAALGPLMERARPLGLSPFAALLAAFAAALRALGAPDTLTLATPHTTRGPKESSCIGYLTNTLPIPLTGPDDLRPSTQLALARDALRRAQAWADLPFPTLLAALPRPAPGPFSPIFQVLFALQDPLPPTTTRGGIRLELGALQAAAAPFELTLELWPEPTGALQGGLLYDARLYSAARIEALDQALREALRRLALPDAAPARPAAPSPRPAQVSGGPLPPAAGPWPGLAAALERTARAHPEAGLRLIEADGSERRWTYPELLAEARALAAGLRAQGLEPGHPVLLLDEGLARTLSAFWACQWLGALPLVAPAPRGVDDPNLERLLSLQPAVGGPLLASASLAARLRPHLPESVRWLRPDPAPAAAAPPPAPPGALAFLQASSGSTARPKLIPITQRALDAHLRAAIAHSGYQPTDRSLSWLPLDHVAALLMCHVKDTVLGARQVHLATTRALADPLRILALVDEERVSHLLIPDFGLALLADALEDRRVRAEPTPWDLRSVRRIANGSETVRLSTTERFLRATAPLGLDPATMQPGFGMAETASVVCFENELRLPRDVRYLGPPTEEGRRALHAEPGPGGVPLVSLGRPLPGVELRIVDAQGRPRAEGEVGELQVRGEVVLPGYLEPGEAGKPGEADGWRRTGGPDARGWFSTGDLGLLDQGRLFLIGRDKETIVLRGAKYAAEQIEQVLGELPGLMPGGVAATALPDGDGEQLGLFLAPRPGEDEERLAREARELLGRRLGISAGVLRMLAAEELPRSPSGKLQRGRLRERFQAGGFPPPPPLAFRRLVEEPAPPGPPTEREAPPLPPILLPGDDGPLRRALIRHLGAPPAPPMVPPGAALLLPPGTGLPAALRALRAAAETPGLRQLLIAGGADPVLDAALGGALACLALERPALALRQVLLPANPEAAAQALLDEAGSVRGPLLIDRRGPRATTAWRPITPRRLPSPFREGGRWLISGGLGQLGHHLARALLERGGARLLLLVHRPVEGGERARRLDALRRRAEERGGAVEVLATDLGRRPDLEPAVTAFEARHGGALDGLLHLAASAAEFMGEPFEKTIISQAIAARLDGLEALLDLRRARPGAWLLAVSSAAAHLGAPGKALYAASCRALEARVQALQAAGEARLRVITLGAFEREDHRSSVEGPTMDPAAILAILERALGEEGPILVGAPPTSAAPSPLPRRAPADAPRASPAAALRETIGRIWAELLRQPRVDPEATFFAQGGHSVLLVQAHARLQQALGRELPIALLFQHPSVARLAEALAGEGEEAPPAPAGAAPPQASPIAVVGMAGRFPRAPDLERLAQRLLRGLPSARRWSRTERLRAGEAPDRVDDPRRVPVRATLEDVDLFDETFFGMSPAEAAATDPQQRLFLECAWQALEQAGLDPERAPGPIGIWAGAGLPGYLLHQLGPKALEPGSLAGLPAILGNDKDHLATRVAWKLDLRGPAVNVQSACSTSLLAVHEAVQALRAGRCALALAGGVNIGFPLGEGHEHQEGHISSPDGHCRAFDAEAAGTFGGDGVGVVLLAPLALARELGLRVHALILGSATNNDGARKAAYTAPSVEGQAEVIRAALADARLDPATVGYIEAHGTGTALGDPVEVRALALALGPRPDGRIRHLAAAKPTLGHGNTAAGIASLLKAVLAVESGELPPILDLRRPNPRLELDGASLVPVQRRQRWEEEPRHAGVSAFGFGGTNVHVLLRSAPRPPPPPPAEERELLALSARDPEALEALRANLRAHLQARPDLSPAELSSTLLLGRRAFPERAVFRWTAGQPLAEALDLPPLARGRAGRTRPLAFLFPGQGAQRPGMLRGLYPRREPVRQRVDEALRGLPSARAAALRELLVADPGDPTARAALASTLDAQPVLFLTGLALAALWEEQAGPPAAWLGHSLGEWAAAVAAGVLEAEEAMGLVLRRAELCAASPDGAMLAVSWSEDHVMDALDPDLDLAAVNAPDRVVVSGPPAAIGRMQARLEALGVASRRLPGAVAFHSRLLEDAALRFEEELRGRSSQPPRGRLFDSVSGGPMTHEAAGDPARWARQLREPVRFAAALRSLLDELEPLTIELGPGEELSRLARRVRAVEGSANGGPVALSALGENAAESAAEAVERALARAWTQGAPWSPPPRGTRLVLPGHPLRRRSHWAGPPPRLPAACGWVQPSWNPAPLPDGPLPLRLGVLGPGPTPADLAAAGDAHGVELLPLHAALLRSPATELPEALLCLDPRPDALLSLLQDIGRHRHRRPPALLVLAAFPRAPTEADPTPGDSGLLDGLLRAARRGLPGLRTRLWLHPPGEPPPGDLLLRLPGAREAAWRWSAGQAWRLGERALTVGEGGRVGPLRIEDGPRGLGLCLAEALADEGLDIELRPWTPDLDGAARRALRLPGASSDLSSLGAQLDAQLAVRPLHRPGGPGPLLDRLCAARVLSLLQAHGIGLHPGARITREELHRRLRPRPLYEPLLEALMALLVEDGVLRAEVGGWVVLGAPGDDADALTEALRRLHPEVEGLLELLEPCVAALPAVISGAREATAVLYPDGRADRVERAEQRTAEHRQDRRQIRLLCAALRARALQRGPDRPLRILELGGGQGLLTWPLALALQDTAFELHFTDIGTGFVEDARARARTLGLVERMRFSRLDAGAPPDPDRFPPGSYDAVVAYNALHAVADLPAALENLRPLLAPGGQLLLVEVLWTARWDLLTWGLIEGWWSHQDFRRGRGPLLSLAAWRELLERHGLPVQVALGEGLDHGLLVAGREEADPLAPSDAARLETLRARPGLRILAPEAAPDPSPRLRCVEPALGDAPTWMGWEAEHLDRLAAPAAGLSAAEAACPTLWLLNPDDPDQGPLDQAFLSALAARGGAALALRPGDALDAEALLELLGRPALRGLHHLPAAALDEAPAVAPAPGPGPTPMGAPRPPPPEETSADPVLAQVTAIAAELLGLPALAPDQDFVELGADSLIMLRLSDRLAQALGRPVPAEAAFAGTTARALAAALRPPEAPAPAPRPPRPSSAPLPLPACLVRLQARGDERPFFMVHPATGVVFPYYRLARAMPPDRPFWALQARGLDGEEPVDTRVEDMARVYVEAIRRVQPRGPYHLGGFSFGCLVAHEMAVQLAAEGEPPGLVALVDEPAPIDGYRPSPWLMLEMIARGSRDALLPFLPEYLALRRAGGDAAPRRLERLLARLTLASFVPPEERELALRQPAIEQLFRLFLLHGRLTLEYEPAAYPHRLTLLKATELRGRAARDPSQGWRMLAGGGVEVHRLPGEHLTLLREPHVAEVARVLAGCLRRAERGEVA